MSSQQAQAEQHIYSYLQQQQDKQLLRILTCGSVDDGKSTLIGRLLHDTRQIYDDQLTALQQDSYRHGTQDGQLDLALLVDGLQAEREQGITIDVAYRYFSTQKTKFILVDSPGHEQYTRNMVTGASSCDLAIILIDARHGVLTQTRRHSFIVSLLGIRHVVVAINKMDLVDYSEPRFLSIRDDYLALAEHLNIPDISFVPISALEGENVSEPSTKMGWYDGPDLLTRLEGVTLESEEASSPFRFPVQYVSRPTLDFRGYAGTVASGEVAVGDKVKLLPSGQMTQIASIVTYDGLLDTVKAGQAITLTLADELDISRGDWLVSRDQPPQVVTDCVADIVWMSSEALQKGKLYDFKLASSSLSGSIVALDYQWDVNRMQTVAAEQLALNEIGRCYIHLNRAQVLEPYQDNPVTGAFIMIDRLTNETVAAGMVVTPVANDTAIAGAVSQTERQQRLGQQGGVLQLTGKRAGARAVMLERALFDRGYVVGLLTPEQVPHPEQRLLCAEQLAAVGVVAVLALPESDLPLRQEGHIISVDHPIDEQVQQAVACLQSQKPQKGVTT